MEEKEKLEQEATANAEANNEQNVEGEATPPQMTSRETFTQTVREFAPDADYDNDENAVYDKANELISSLRSKGDQLNSFVNKLTERFNSNPEEAAAFLDYSEGMPLVAAIRKNLGDEALSIKEGDEGWNEYVKAGEERVNRQKEQQALMDEILENSKKSNEAFEAFAKDNNLTEDEKNALWSYMQADLADMSKGKYSAELFGKYKRAKDYDADLAAAGEQGRAEGRNESIEAEERKKRGNGLPHANGEGAMREELDKPKKNTTADWLGGMIRK